jgi:hypothetical protein
MASKAALIAAATSRAAPPPDLAAAQMRKDKKEAVRLARLKLKASARGAAPPPPPPGGKAAAPAAAPPPSSDGKPLEVKKYRALEAYSGEISYEPGATIFVMGEADANGMVMGVVGGASGMCKMSTLTVITDELLAAERKAKEEAAAVAREKREAELAAQLGASDGDAEAALKALEEKYANSDTPIEAEGKSAESIAMEQKVAAELAEAKAEEDKIKAEAARLEELMRQLDMDSDEDED